MNAYEEFLKVINAKGAEYYRRLELVPILKKMIELEKKEAEALILERFNGYDQNYIDALAFMNSERSTDALENALKKIINNENNIAKYYLSIALWNVKKEKKYLSNFLEEDPSNPNLNETDRIIYVGLFASLPKEEKLLNLLLDYMINDNSSTVRFNALRSFFIILGIMKREDNAILEDLRILYFNPIDESNRMERKQISEILKIKYIHQNSEILKSL